MDLQVITRKLLSRNFLASGKVGNVSRDVSPCRNGNQGYAVLRRVRESLVGINENRKHRVRLSGKSLKRSES